MTGPTREDIKAGGLAAYPVRWVADVLRQAPRALRPHEVASTLGWTRGVTLRLLRRCERLQVAQRCPECRSWIAGRVDPDATSTTYAALAAVPSEHQRGTPGTRPPFGTTS